MIYVLFYFINKKKHSQLFLKFQFQENIFRIFFYHIYISEKKNGLDRSNGKDVCFLFTYLFYKKNSFLKKKLQENLNFFVV